MPLVRISYSNAVGLLRMSFLSLPPTGLFSYGTVSGDSLPLTHRTHLTTSRFVPDRDTTAPRIFSFEDPSEDSSQRTETVTHHSPDHCPGRILTCLVLINPPLNGKRVSPMSALGTNDESVEQFKGMNPSVPFASSFRLIIHFRGGT